MTLCWLSSSVKRSPREPDAVLRKTAAPPVPVPHPNRLELGAQFSDHYRNIQADPRQVEAAILERGVRCLLKDRELFV
jgi:hypothetical protein